MHTLKVASGPTADICQPPEHKKPPAVPGTRAVLRAAEVGPSPWTHTFQPHVLSAAGNLAVNPPEAAEIDVALQKAELS